MQISDYEYSNSIVMFIHFSEKPPKKLSPTDAEKLNNVIDAFIKKVNDKNDPKSIEIDYAKNLINQFTEPKYQ